MRKNALAQSPSSSSSFAATHRPSNIDAPDPHDHADIFKQLSRTAPKDDSEDSGDDLSKNNEDQSNNFSLMPNRENSLLSMSNIGFGGALKLDHVPEAKKIEESQSEASRLARKAEAARASRKRKKAYVHSLEERVTCLSTRLTELQAATNLSTHKLNQQDLKDQAMNLLRNEIQMQNQVPLSPLVSSDSSQEQLANLMKQFVSNSRQRQAAADIHLAQLEDCFAPSAALKFMLWGIKQCNGNVDGAVNNSSTALWSSCVNEVGLTPSQLDQLMQAEGLVREVMLRREQSTAFSKIIREHLRLHFNSLHANMDEIMRCLTPKQIARFCLWVDENAGTARSAPGLGSQPASPPPSPHPSGSN